MKKLKYLLSAAAMLVLAVACNHDPDEITISSNDPTIAPHADVVVNDNTVNEDFTLVWSPARFGEKSTVTYTLSGKRGDGEYVELTQTSACNFTITNYALFEQLGVTLTGNYKFSFKVEAASERGDQKSARPVEINFLYTKITYLWIFGGYQGWDPSGAASHLLQGSDGVFRGFVQLPEDGEFKFASQPSWDGTNYGPASEGVLSNSNDAANFSSKAGLYYLEANLEAMTYVQIPITNVSLIGEAVGGWNDGDDIQMLYNPTDKVWTTIANLVEGKNYKIRCNNMWNIPVGENQYNCSLGGAFEELVFGGSDLTAEAGGITGFTLSLFDYPYHMKVGEVVEDKSKLYVANSANNWNYMSTPVMAAINDAAGKPTSAYCGVADFSGATSPSVLLARMQTPLGTRFGGSMDALVAYAGGVEATPIGVTAAPHYLYADLTDGVMKMTDIPMTKISIVGGFNGWSAATAVDLTRNATTGLWEATHTFDADGEFRIIFNGAPNATVDGVEHQTSLGGSCKGLVVNGGNLAITAGSHTFALDLRQGPVTLAIDGKVEDLITLPTSLGITGDFSGYSWDTAAAPRLWGNPATGTYWGYAAMYGTTYGFKFTYGTTWIPGAAVADTQYDFTLSTGDNMMIADGTYRWDVNLKTMKATAKQVVVSLIGDGVGSWTADVDMTYDPVSRLHKARVTSPGGEFKVRFNHEWDAFGNLGGDVNNLTIGGANIAITAGSYDFALDLVHTPYKITVTPVL